ncbi:putative pentafunctional AROM polypeptide [Aspergillus lucknowensis]|uniref:Uncharacterized protein n=1 Tax=Aspergillus lucknowensis TaxID=176173 RepID=A0ABR4LR84_9EURO
MHNETYPTCCQTHYYNILQLGNISHTHTPRDDGSLGGSAVSLPHETAILSFLDQISSCARDIKSANIVLMTGIASRMKMKWWLERVTIQTTLEFLNAPSANPLPAQS